MMINDFDSLSLWLKLFLIGAVGAVFLAAVVVGMWIAHVAYN